MKFEIKFRGIAFRWFINVFLIVLVVVVAVGFLFSAFVSATYMDQVRSLGSDYADDFSVLKQTNSEDFKDVAISVSQAFAYKDKVEVQVFDKNGDLFLSTAGVLPEESNAPDYDAALSSQDNTATYNGENAGGEKIYAMTTAVFDKSGEYVGAYRWITSLDATYC